MRTIQIRGKTPAEYEYAILTSVPFEKKPISYEERNNKIKMGFIMLGCIIACAVAGAILHAIGRSGEGTAGAGIMMFMGFVIMYLGSPLCFLAAIASFLSILSEPRGKKPQKSLHEYLSRVLIGDDSSNFSKKCKEYSYQVLLRMVPDSAMPARKNFTKHLSDFRIKMLESLNADFKEVFGNDSNGEHEINLIGNSVCISSENLSPGIEKHVVEFDVSLTANYTDPNTYKSSQVVYSRVKIATEMTFVQTGKYWYIYDNLPEIQFQQ